MMLIVVNLDRAYVVQLQHKRGRTTQDTARTAPTTPQLQMRTLKTLELSYTLLQKSGLGSSMGPRLTYLRLE